MVEKLKKIIYKKQFETYDEEGTVHSLVGKCTFCRIASSTTKVQLLVEDEHVVLFQDKKPKAFIHLQCVPKRHIKDWTHLRPTLSDISLLEHMHKVGHDFLEKHYPKGWRFGFHSPGENSQYHLHLHCIVLPILNPKNEKRYGISLAKPEMVLELLSNKYHKQLKMIEIENAEKTK